MSLINVKIPSQLISHLRDLGMSENIAEPTYKEVFNFFEREYGVYHCPFYNSFNQQYYYYLSITPVYKSDYEYFKDFLEAQEDAIIKIIEHLSVIS